MTKKYKIFLIISIVTIVLLVVFNIYLFVSKQNMPVEDKTEKNYPFQTLEEIEEKENSQVSLYFYEQLDASEKKAYHAVERMIHNAISEGLDVSAYYPKSADGFIYKLPSGCTEKNGEKIIQAIRNDHPEYFYLKDYQFSTDKDGDTIVVGAFLFDAKLRRKMMNELTETVRQISESVKSAKDYATENKLQEYLVRHCSRDLDTRNKIEHNYRVKHYLLEKGESKEYEKMTTERLLSQTAYGALVIGRATDEGYAAAVQIVLHTCGIPAIMVHGACSSWNIVWLGGIAYHLDVYGDDCGQIVDYTYFNLDESIEESEYYHLDRTYFIYPECKSTAASYYVQQGTYFDEFYAEDVLWAIGTLAKKEDIIYLKFSEKAFGRACAIIKRKNLFTKYLKSYCPPNSRSEWKSYYLGTNEAFHTVLIYKGEISPFDD